ncbi:sensor domain-containing protein [Paraburkholderia steynii]|uniref:sensor domain-containing protein n=1 Tax=Paraburkholderia steynii TaxID=1245441 RepID=UPI001423DD90|nr:EAL domain-containing protein [Paraburkholderia steynii]
MTFDIHHWTEQFITVASEIDDIAMEFRLSSGSGNYKNNAPKLLQALSVRLRDLTVEMDAAVSADVERKREIFKALAASEHQFRSLAGNLPAIIARWDCSGNYLYTNPWHEETFGKKASEIVGTRIPEIYDSISSGIAAVVESGKTSRLFRQMVYDELSRARIYEVSLTPERDEEGQIVSVLGIGREVTEQAAIEQKLVASERHFRTVAENLPNYLMRFTPRAQIVYLNPILATFLRLDTRDVVGKTPRQLSPKGGLDEYERKVLETAKTGNENHLELQVITEEGHPGVHEIHLVAEHDESGEVVSVLGIGDDITARRRAEQELKRALDFAEGIIAAIPDILLEVDRDGRCLNVWTKNPDRVAMRSKRLTGKTVNEVLPQGQANLVMHAIREADTQGVSYGHIILVDLPGGSRRWFEYSLAKKPGEQSSVDTFLVLSRDVTARRQTEQKLADREQEFRTLVEHSPDTVARYDSGFRRVYVNPTFAALVQGGEASLIGKTPSEYPGGPYSALHEKKLNEVFTTGKALEFESKWRRDDGVELCYLIKLAPELGERGTVVRVLAVGRDISELQMSREKIHRMAYYDQLTSLPNRTLFNERLRQTVTEAGAFHRLTGVMMIDMDQFKGVNDTLGHAAGDELLREAAVRLMACVRTSDSVARFGGDEFAILLPAVSECRVLEHIAKAIIDSFDKPFQLNGKDVFVSCSIGIALCPTDSVEPDDLMKYADSAMYHAKRSGRRSFRFYSKELTVEATARLALESELRRAIAGAELELHYQPKVSIRGNIVVGSEALLRWNRPGVGLVPPNEFIPLAEETGLISELGCWVLREACKTATELNEGEAIVHRVAINLSARQFQSYGLASHVNDILVETGCRPEWLELEITESLLLAEDEAILSTLSSFREMGLTIAIDDFGTGYSSLSYLTRFPIDTLKIDKSFVHQMTIDRRHGELVKAILSIADCLGLQVVAEGVETLEQAAFLEANGCRIVQGFLYSKPMSKASILTLPRSLVVRETSV